MTLTNKQMQRLFLTIQDMRPFIPNYPNRCFGFSAFVSNLYVSSVQGSGAGTNLLWKLYLYTLLLIHCFMEQSRAEVHLWLCGAKANNKTKMTTLSSTISETKADVIHFKVNHIRNSCVQRMRSSFCQITSWMMKQTSGQMFGIKEPVGVPAGTCWGFLWKLTAMRNLLCYRMAVSKDRGQPLNLKSFTPMQELTHYTHMCPQSICLEPEPRFSRNIGFWIKLLQHWCCKSNCWFWTINF